MRALPGLLLFLCWPCVSGQDALSDEEWEAWFKSEDDAEARALAVNEGELRFLPDMLPEDEHRLEHRLRITPQSLRDGFVELYQCHENLDAVAAAQVVYRYKHMRKLRITSSTNIQKLWVEGNSIQMQNLEKGATLCARAEVRILYPQSNGKYVLRNGPFHRQFLDGFYPMQVILSVSYPQTLLDFVSTQPEPQPGLVVKETAQGLMVDARFEGRLMLEVNFIARHPG